ncbi:uncharacterized protein METZ01_LOCUS309212, partial [marine metagenome]
TKFFWPAENSGPPLGVGPVAVVFFLSFRAPKG